MLISNTVTGNLDSDSSDYIIEGVRSRLNMRVGFSEGNSLGTSVSLKGNTLIPNGLLPEGDNKCIGVCKHEKLHKVYFFVWNSENYDSIFEFDYLNETISLVLQNLTHTSDIDVLNFDTDYRINHANVIDGEEYVGGVNQKLLLYWTDNLNAPRKINIERCKANYYNNAVTDEIISQAKARPSEIPFGDFISDATLLINNIKGNLFQFKARYVYNDGERGAWSSISKLFTNSNENLSSTNDATTNNAISLNLLYSLNPDVVKIELAGRITNSVNSDFFSIDTIPNVVPATELDPIRAAYIFKNNGQYLPLDLNESNLQFDYLPQKAATQEIVDGNVIVLGNIVEGYDNVDIDCSVDSDYVPRVDVPSSGSISMVNKYIRYDHSSDRQVYEITISGQPSMGDVFRVTFIKPSGATYVKAEYIVPNNTTSINTVVSQIFSDMNSTTPGPDIRDEYIKSQTPNVSGVIYYEVNRVDEEGPKLIVCQALSTSTANSIKEFKQNADYQFGIVYYDKFGRAGAVNSGIELKSSSAYSVYQNGYTPRFRVNINHLPPSWAESYSIVRTKNLSYAKWFYWASKPVQKTIGSKTYIEFSLKTISTFNEIENSSILAYDFTKGDRLRLIYNLTDGGATGFAPSKNYEILNYEVIETSGSVTDVVVRIIKPDTSVVLDLTKFYLFEIFSPRKTFSQDSLNVFYEVGVKLPIVSDFNFNKIHSGTIQDQVISPSTLPAIVELFDGDSYIKRRLIPTVKDVNSPAQIDAIVEDPNFSDYYDSDVYDEGYANVIDDSARQMHKPTVIYFSQPFVPQSNINGLSRFYAENFEEYPRDKGNIQRLATKENYLICYQQLRVGSIPIFRRIVEDLDKASQVGISQKLLNEITYYSYETGIGDNPSAFCRLGQYFYHIDTNKGLVARLSLGGIEVISDTYKMNSYFSERLKDYIGIDKIIAVDDNDKMEAIFTFEDSGESLAETIAFSELSRGFTSFYSFIPDHGFSVGSGFYTFKNGALYQHDTNSNYNNFYGVQYGSEVELVFNKPPMLVKSFLSVAIQSNNLWTLPTITTELNQLSNLIAEDFEIDVPFDNKEGVYYANLLRDVNSDGGLIEGSRLRGSFITMTLSNNSTSLTKLFTVTTKYNISHQGIK